MFGSSLLFFAACLNLHSSSLQHRLDPSFFFFAPELFASSLFLLFTASSLTRHSSSLQIGELHAAGKIIEFGLSNFPAWKVADIYYRCKAKGVVVPTVYQGCYNALTRSMEFEAAACFRELGIRSYHFNPLAGGMLSGKYSGIDDSLKDSGRFGSASPISGAGYSARYWHQQYFDALEGIRAAWQLHKQSRKSTIALSF